jgi:TonB-dependent receptor
VTFSPAIDDPDDVRSNPSTVAGDYLFDVIEPASSDTRDTDLVGSLDLSLPFGSSGLSGTFRFGAKFRDKNKTQNIVEQEYELSAGDIVLGTDYGELFDETLSHPRAYALPSVGTSPDQVTGFVTTFNGQLDQTVNIEAETGDYDLDERVLAGYAMTELNLTPRLLLVPGVRYEHTQVNTAGFDYDAATDALTPVSDEHDYGRLFPMVHARLAVTSHTNVRAAFTTSIQRPNFYDLVPYRIFDDPDLQIGNPELDPMTARSFDLLVESYDDRIGVMSAGAFYKDISDPIFVFTEDNAGGGETEQPRNGESGWIRGVEVALQRQLVGGFGIYGNYTFTDSEGELPNGRTARLQGQAEHVFNAALSYERSAFLGQVSVNYNGDFVAEYADEDFEDVYIADHLQLDLSASYQVTPSARVFLELVNLTNEPLIAYRGVRERPIQMEYYEAWGRLGVRLAW